MKIVFLLVGTEGRPIILNGDTIRNGGAACSGTDQSMILVSEYLAEKGHDVTLVLDKTDGATCRGVKYTDFNYGDLVNSEVDILITALWFDKYKEIPFKVNLRIAAKRTLKNSSKLLEKIPKKRILSNNGTVTSPASCKTRELKANQLFSLSIYLCCNT